MKYHIFISATEVSADQIGAKFVLDIHTLFPQKFYFSGWGGPSLAAQGVNLIGDVCSSNSVGITEAIPFLWKNFKFLQISKKFLKENPVDLLLCIDGQGKNLPLSKIAKKMGIKIAYILPPPVFIWGVGVRKKLLHIDLLVCLFFENFQILSQHHPNVILLKHPLITDFESAMEYSKRSSLVGLFPGSRKSEIQRLLPDMVQIFRLLNDKIPKLQGVLCVAHPCFVELIKKHLPQNLPIQISSQPASIALQQCKVAILASGTITLQALWALTPAVVIYKLSFLSTLVVKFLLKEKIFALPNILLKKIVFPEFFNSGIVPGKIAQILLPYLQKKQDNISLLENCQQLEKSIFSQPKGDFLLAKYLIKTIRSTNANDFIHSRLYPE